MKVEKINAIKLRKLGKSYNEISRILKISKSTLNYWFKGKKWSKKLKDKLTRLAKKNAGERMKKIFSKQEMEA